jgi:hypothetical protein
MPIGFEFSEKMSGSYHTLDDPGLEHPMTIHVRARVKDVRRFLIDPTASIEGHVQAEGLATNARLEGSLEINPVLRRKLVYDFSFTDDAGRDCRFHGEKDVEAVRLLSTMTTLPGSIFVEDREHARAVLRFRLRQDLVRMLSSFRPRRK